MREIRIAIVSKRIELSRFFALEAERFGFEVMTFDKDVGDLSAFDMCILDTEGMRHLPSVLAHSVVLIADGANAGDVTDSGIIRLGYPTSIRDIDRIYARLLLGGEVENKKEKEEAVASGERIYFYREIANTVRYKDRNIQLSDYELRLLERLCASADEPVSRDELNRLLGAEKGNIADVYICRLRRKLESDDKRIIFTVRSRGYKIITDMEWE